MSFEDIDSLRRRNIFHVTIDKDEVIFFTNFKSYKWGYKTINKAFLYLSGFENETSRNNVEILRKWLKKEPPSFEDKKQIAKLNLEKESLYTESNQISNRLKQIDNQLKKLY